MNPAIENKDRVLLVIPAYQESGRLPKSLGQLLPVLDNLGNVDLLVVDDGSGVAEQGNIRILLEDLSKNHPCLLQPILMKKNCGKGAAVRRAWDAGYDQYDWLAFTDADLSVPAEEVARFIGIALEQENPSTLLASRVKMLGRNVERNALRHAIGRIFANYVAKTTNLDVYDSQCGLKIIPSSAYQKIKDKLHCNRFAFDVDLLCALGDEGEPVIEVPVDWSDVKGSKINIFTDGPRMFKDVNSIRLRRIDAKHRSKKNEQA